MVRSFNLSTEVSSDREIRFTLPDDIPEGPAEIVVLVSTKESTPARTLAELAKSEFIGMWKDREDIDDSEKFARCLRETAWDRGR